MKKYYKVVSMDRESVFITLSEYVLKYPIGKKVKAKKELCFSYLTLWTVQKTF